MKVKLSEIKKKLQGINNGVDEAESQVIDLKHKEEKDPIRTARIKKNPPPKNTQNEDNVRSLWDNFKHTNICFAS